MATEGYDWDPDEHVFRLRDAVRAPLGPFPLTVREALELYDPGRYREGEPSPWPPWAWQ